MVRQGIIVVVSADGTEGGGEATQAGHVESVIARSNQDGGGAWREGGKGGGGEGGREDSVIFLFLGRLTSHAEHPQ